MPAYYDSYEPVDAPRRRRSHRNDRGREHDYDGETRYVETRETYVSGDPPYSARATDIVRRREDSDLSIEEIERKFPPPGYDRYDSSWRSRSADRGGAYGAYLGDPRDDHRVRRKLGKEEDVEPRRRSLSRNQKIIAAVSGAALAVGGKELWDRRENQGHAPEKRNILGTAAIGAAGAFVGYEGAEIIGKKFGKEKKVKEKAYMTYRGKDGQIMEYYSSETDEEKSQKKKSRRKSIIEGALGLAGLGAATKAASGHDNRDRDDRRSRRRDSSADSRRSRRDRSRGPNDEGLAKAQQAAKAALLAGAAEAFRVRKEPGTWTGAKGKRIITAAIGAGGIDAAVDKDPEKHSKRHLLESVIGGLAGNRLINGSRAELEGGKKSGRSRSRSRGGNGGSSTGAGLAALATAGLGAIAGKKLMDRSKSRDRGDDRDRRRRSRSSDDDSDPGDKHRRRRSRSVTDYARKGLAAIGIGGGTDKHRDRREVEETRITQKTRRSRRGSDDSYDSRYDDSRSADGDRRRRRNSQNRKKAGGKDYDDTDSLGSSSGDEKRVRKMRGKQILTAGLATVATIHAAHNVYQSFEKREARQKAVAEGEMTHEEARKLKMKAQLQDMASIGIAALGIKGAVSEWKEMNEMRHEYNEFAEKKEERHKKRLERQRKLKEQSNENNSTTVTRRPRSNSHPQYRSSPEFTYDERYDRGRRFYDEGPYASGGLPAPPIGRQQ